MNFREIILIVAIALGTSWVIEYFIGSKKAAEQEGQRSGQSFTAQKVIKNCKPLQTAVAFIDQKRTVPTIATSIETDVAIYDFSSDGASLERLRFKRQLGEVMGTITTIFPSTGAERENRCFLVALQENTPFFYTLVDRVEKKDSVDLVYEAETADVVIRKVFTVYRTSYKIDLSLTLRPKHKGYTLEPRILFPAPLMPDILSRDTRSLIVNNEKGSLTKIVRSKITPDQGWFTPTLFGADNRYFVHALVSDTQHFVQRAYGKVSGTSDLYAIVEGPRVEDEQTWTVSFYCGPKELAAMGAVDVRLEETFDYSWVLAPIAKMLLAFLVFFKGFLGNYGLAIILLTFILRLVLLPFALSSARSFQQTQKQTAEMQRKLQYIQQRYKDDPEQCAREKEALIRKHGLPGLGGCIPALLQLPFFFALNTMIANSIQLYQAPFVGWITDLSAPDSYYVLPLLLFIVFSAQGLTTVQSNQRIQLFVIGAVLGAFSINWAAGVCLYVFVSTLLGFIQTGIQKKLGWA